MTTSTRPAGDPVATALHATLISPNESDSNSEPANVVDGLFAIARAVDRLAYAIEGPGAPGHSPLTSAIRDIAESIERAAS